MTEEEKFIESLYIEAEKQMREVYKLKKNNKEEILNEISKILLAYTIVNDLMKISKKDKNKEYSRFAKLLLKVSRGDAQFQEKTMNVILSDVTNKTFSYYSYNADLKDVRKIIENNFKGKHFSERIWNNENDVSKKVYSQIEYFLNGKVNVNKIKKNIEESFNASAYNTKRLVETEINRCSNEAFISFCKEVGVKKIRRNEILDSKICDKCKEIDGKIFKLDEAPGVIHPLCRGFNEVYE